MFVEYPPSPRVRRDGPKITVGCKAHKVWRRDLFARRSWEKHLDHCNKFQHVALPNSSEMQLAQTEASGPTPLRGETFTQCGIDHILGQAVYLGRYQGGQISAISAPESRESQRIQDH